MAKYNGGAHKALCGLLHMNMPRFHFHRPRHHQRPYKMAPYFTEVVSILRTYIWVIQRHSQGTLHFYYIIHIIPLLDIGLSIEVLTWSEAPFSSSVKNQPHTTPEHCEQPFKILDRHWNHILYIKKIREFEMSFSFPILPFI